MRVYHVSDDSSSTVILEHELDVLSYRRAEQPTLLDSG